MTSSISQLPLPPVSQRIQTRLTACPSSQPSYHSILLNNPSTQRRTTTFQSGHLSYVTPLPISFPYRLPRVEGAEDKAYTTEDVEKWLTSREPLERSSEGKDGLGLYSNENRKWPVVLLGFSQKCLDEVVPHLDAGDAAHIVLADYNKQVETGVEEKRNSAREELVGVLGGREVIMNLNETDTEESYHPWSLRYGGRQFGQWAGQLGDGRAISLLETVNPAGEIQEIQIKGAGRTPFSRRADGLAVLRSSIREFLGSEYASAFPETTLPTSRALSLNLISDLPVNREYGWEKGAIVSRLAPTFLRIGSFEILNPPENEFVFSLMGDSAYAGDEWNLLRDLTLVVKDRLGSDPKVTTWEMVREITRRNASMVAGWQAWGFMHGVINTDNVSVLGICIDYGPFAFMDKFNLDHICNHSDDSGRYSYRAQPEMVFYAMSALLKATSPLIGYEESHSALAPAGWADEVDNSTIDSWKALASRKENDLEDEFWKVYEEKYLLIMGKRLGIPSPTDRDKLNLINPLLSLLQRHSLDFHSFFRSLALLGNLSSFSTDAPLLDKLLASSSHCDQRSAKVELVDWLKLYSARVGEGERKGTKEWNPRFVLRQWILEEVIDKCERGEVGCRRDLARILEMASNPFRSWGGEDVSDEEAEAQLSTEEKEERRLCGLGAENMLG
ncbi:Uncharacterized conserved protein (YdiU family) [Phaffia rhodozyma]|uniref:Selenoprotein O n=1 Tax=Phaffia rhodozyma TaxID=264483 RepID=A0A0F7SNB2_PHARH|nr:Uncharacterized conserved protein (YdiU family) [Phaffia rhodozyma]